MAHWPDDPAHSADAGPVPVVNWRATMSDVQVSSSMPAVQVPAQPAASTAAMKMPPANPRPAPMPESVAAPQAFRVDPQQQRQHLQDVVQQLNSQVEKTSTSLGFQVDEVAGRNVVTVRNKETGDVVRQIPSDAVLAVAHNIERLRGLLFNGKA